MILPCQYAQISRRRSRELGPDRPTSQSCVHLGSFADAELGSPTDETDLLGLRGGGSSLVIGIRDCSSSEESTVDRWEGDVRLARLQS